MHETNTPSREEKIQRTNKYCAKKNIPEIRGKKIKQEKHHNATKKILDYL